MEGILSRRGESSSKGTEAGSSGARGTEDGPEVAGKGSWGKGWEEARKGRKQRQRVLNTKLRNLNSPGSRESWKFLEMKSE